MRKFRGILLAFLLVVVDQITKYWARTVLAQDGPVDIITGVFKLQYLENRGAAFGILQNKLILLMIMTIIVLGLVFVVFFKVPNEKKYRPIEYICLFIIAGAIGNMIDRLFLNYVVDFLYFELIDFPIFNVADIYVTVSAVLLVILFLFYYKDEDFQFLSKKKENHKEM